MKRFRHFVVSLCLPLTLTHSSGWACDGPGASELITKAEFLGWWLFVITAIAGVAGILILQLQGCRFRNGSWLLLVIAIHPGWWLGARSGDCGALRVLGSWIGLGLMIFCLVLALVLAIVRRRRRSDQR